MKKDTLTQHFKDKNILFVTTKNLDYIRNRQEIDIISENCSSVVIIGSYSKSYVMRLIQVYFRLLFTSVRRFDVVFIGFAPQLILPLFSLKLRNTKIIADFFVSFYDTLVHDRKRFKDRGLISSLLNKLDKYTIRNANIIIADTMAHASYFVQELDAKHNQVEVLYLSANTSIYYPRIEPKPLHLENKFIVLYFGSILPLQGVNVVLEAIGLLAQEEDIHFYMIGPIKNKSGSQNPKANVTYINWLPQGELANHIAFSDLCLAGHFADDIDKAKRTIPGKAYIYHAMGKKMILGDNLATRELYDECSPLITFIEMGSVTALAETILELKNSHSG